VLTPEDHQVWGNLGDAYRRTPGKGELANGAYDRASELARAELGVNPDSARTRTMLAYYLMRQGRIDEAVIEIGSASSSAGGDVYAHYYAALVHKELGDIPAAVVQARKAFENGYPATLLRADPEFAEILRDPVLAAALEAGPEQ
jgi:tetratricopeptide (TPR) repeat protein